MEKLADMILESNTNSQVDKDIIVYGLNSAIEQSANVLTTVVIGISFGLLLESIVFLVSFSMVRMYAGGYHCKSAIHCYFMSSGIIVAVLAIVKFTPMEYIIPISVIALLLSVPVILKLAPVGTVNRPLDAMEQKHYRKKTISHLGIECCAILIMFFVELHTMAYVLCLGIFITMGVVALQKRG